MRQDTEPPVRGWNPEPPGGWPWCLSDYEVAYVGQFGVRPRRGENWRGSPRDEQSLDDEATELHRRTTSTPAPVTAPPRRVRRTWPWVTVNIILGAMIAAGITAGTLLTVDTTSINQQTTTLRGILNGQ